MSKNLCVKCGAELSENVAKCPECGAQVAASPADSDLFAEFLMSDESSEPKAKPSTSDSGLGQASDSGVQWATEEIPASAEDGIDLGRSQASDSGVKWADEPSDSGPNWSTESGVGLAAPQAAAESEEPIDTTAPEPAGTAKPATPSESDRTQISRTPPIGPGPEGAETAFFNQEGSEDAGVEFAEYEPGGADEQVVAPEGEEGEAVPEFASDMADEMAAEEGGPAGLARPQSSALAALAPAGTAAMAAPRKTSILAIVAALVGGIVLGGGGGAGAVHFLMLQPKVAELNTAQNDKTKLNADLTALRADKASVDETIKQTETRLADVQKELVNAQNKVRDESAKADQANNEKTQLAKSRAAAEAERDVVKLEADGSAVLALNPVLILAAELLPKPADLKASPDLAKLWSDYFVRAETLLGEAIKGNPNRARDYALRAWAYQARGGEPAEIEADLKNALELDAATPDPVVQFIAARIYEQIGKAEEASQYLAAAAKAAPAAGAGPGAVAPVQIAERRGEILRHVALARAAGERTGELADTLRLLDRALALEAKEAAPADRAALRMERASLLLRRGSQLQSAGQVEPAVQALEAAAKSASEAAEIAQAANLSSAANALYTQGRALELLGKLDDALQAFEAGTRLARDDAEKSRFVAARSRVRTAKVARTSANAPQSGVRGHRDHTESWASGAGSGDARATSLHGLPYGKLALLSALLTGVQDEAKKPAPRTPPGQEPAKKDQPDEKPEADRGKPDESADKPAEESSKTQEPAKPKTPPAPLNPELEQALREAEQAIKDSGGKSADAYYAKGLALSAMKRFDPAMDAFLAGAPQITESADVGPEHFIRAVADAYRQRALTPQESKIAQLEELVTGLTESLQQKTTQLGEISTKLESTTVTLDETQKNLADERAKLAGTEKILAETEATLAKERVDLVAQTGQHELWKGRYKGLMVATAEENQRESAKLYAQGLNHFFTGKYAAAVETLSEAIRMQPRDARYRYFRGLAYYRQNSMAQAENDLKEASALERQEVPRRREVDKALLRIQGKERLWLESFRPEL